MTKHHDDEATLDSAVYLIRQIHETTEPDNLLRGEHRHIVAAMHVLTGTWLHLHRLLTDDPDDA